MLYVIPATSGQVCVCVRRRSICLRYLRTKKDNMWLEFPDAPVFASQKGFPLKVLVEVPTVIRCDHFHLSHELVGEKRPLVVGCVSFPLQSLARASECHDR